jgi:hypothetical protein
MKISLIIFFLFLIITSSILFIDSVYFINKLTVFIITNLILIFSSTVQIFYLKKKYPTIFFANPPVLCTIFTFLIPFSFTNIFINPITLQEIVNFTSLNKLYFIIINALNIMWVGYWFSDFIINKTNPGQVYIDKLKKILVLPYNKVNFLFLLSMIFIYLMTFFSTNYLNIFGYFSNIYKLNQFKNYLYLFKLMYDLIWIAFITLTLLVIYKKQNVLIYILYLIVLLCIFITEVVSGFKFGIFLPYLIIFFIFYIFKNRFSYSILLISIFFLFLSYSIIPEFRKMSDQFKIHKPESKSFEIIDNQFNLFISNQSFYKKELEIKQKQVDGQDQEPFEALTIDIEEQHQGKIIEKPVVRNKFFLKLYSIFLDVGSRINQLHDTSHLLEIMTFFPNLSSEKEKPKFMEAILIAPLTAIIPRIVWENKPTNIESNWSTILLYRFDCKNKYKQEDCDRKTVSGSTAMSSFLYSYFAGGITFVLIFYFFIGFLQNLIFSLFSPGKYLAPTLLFLILTFKISFIDSAIYGIISFFFRELIIIFFMQYLLFKKN